MTAREPHEPQLPRGQGKWRLVTAILLIASLILAGVAIYQQEQIAALNRNLSSVITTIGGTSYYYETVANSPNGTNVLFHGVTFTFLQMPGVDYSVPSNYTYAGSVRLTNGTQLNLNGKTVRIEGVNVTLLPGFAITFPDGFVVVCPTHNVTASYDSGLRVYWLTFTGILPPANPWLTQHDNIQAGVSWRSPSSCLNGNVTNTCYLSPPTLTLYVSVQT